MTSLGDFQVTNYLNDPSFYGSQLLYDPATEDPYSNPAVRERIFNALQGTTQTQAEMQALQSPESTWQMSGTGYNAGLNIPDAPDRNSSDLGDIATFLAIAGGLGGIGSALAGGLGSSGAGLGGFDALTAADMAAGDAMLGGMGQDYGSFLNSLGGASGASVAPSLPSTPSTQTPVSFASGTTGNATPAIYDEATGALVGQNNLGSAFPNYPGVMTGATGGLAANSLGGAIANGVGQSLGSTVGNAAGSAVGNSLLGGAAGGVSNSALGGLLGALTASMGGAQQTGTQTSIQDIPDWQKPYVTQAMQGAQTAYQNSTPSSLLAPAEQQMLQTIQGNYLNPASNPYLRDTFDQGAKAMSDSYLTTTQPRTDALFGRSGQAFGGNSGYQETVARNQLGFGQNLKNLATDIYGGNYTRERQNQVNATQNAPSYATGQVNANFAPVNNYATIAGQRTGSQTSTPLYENRAGQALYGGLLGSQIFR